VNKLVILTSKGVSLKGVANDISVVANEYGVETVVIDNYMLPYQVARMGDAVITVMTFNPLTATHWLLINHDLSRYGVSTLMYSTVEGIPSKQGIRDWMVGTFPIVANSNYTKSRIEFVGIPVLDVVYHGINFRHVERATTLVPKSREYIRSKLGDAIVAGIVSMSHPRKGLQLFKDVVAMVRSVNKDIKFFVVTDYTGASIFSRTEGVYAEDSFGKRDRVSTLSMIGAFDIYIQPSLAEGFGLPVLEAMAMGVPSVHLAYDPLTEFSDRSFNFHVPYSDVVFRSFRDGIDYELHLYNVKDFANTVIDAVECMTKRKSEWEDRKAKALEKARKFDIFNLYRRLIELLE